MLATMQYTPLATDEGAELRRPSTPEALRGRLWPSPVLQSLLVLLGLATFIQALFYWPRDTDSHQPLAPLSHCEPSHESLPSYQQAPGSRPEPLSSSLPAENRHGQLSFCEANPVLARLNRSAIIALEPHWRQWHHGSIRRAQQLSVALSSGVEIGQYYVYPQQLPTLDHNVCAKTIPGVVDGVRYIAPVDSLMPCASLAQFGQSLTAGDTAKWLCEGNALLNDTDCVVYSLGSNNQFEFEESVLAQFKHCHMYTFDCTSSPPPTPIPRLHFERSCVGDTDAVIQGRQYHTLQSLMSANHHSSVSLLKMDIETYEFDVFHHLLAEPYSPQLPYQISFETHFLHLFGLPAAHLALFEQLYYAGYRLVSHENNVQCRSCNEWTMVRVYC